MQHSMKKQTKACLGATWSRLFEKEGRTDSSNGAGRQNQRSVLSALHVSARIPNAC